MLETLLDGPKHGYEIISAIEQRRNVRPSAGSIYPTLQMLEDGGFVTSEQSTASARTRSPMPGARCSPSAATTRGRRRDTPDAHQRVREAAVKLAAAMLNARGSDEQSVDKIREVLNKARKDIYAILASDES